MCRMRERLGQAEVSASSADTPTVKEAVDLNELVGGSDIDCECMLCHLPIGQPHPPIEWRYTLRFPGPYPAPGTSIMLLCDPCKRDWEGNQGDFMGYAERLHKV